MKHISLLSGAKSAYGAFRLVILVGYSFVATIVASFLIFTIGMVSYSLAWFIVYIWAWSIVLLHALLTASWMDIRGDPHRSEQSEREVGFVVGNHPPFLGVPWYLVGLWLRIGHRPIRFVTKADLEEDRIMRLLSGPMARLGAIFIDRREGEASAEKLRTIVSRAVPGEVFGLFLDGTRYKRERARELPVAFRQSFPWALQPRPRGFASMMEVARARRLGFGIHVVTFGIPGDPEGRLESVASGRAVFDARWGNPDLPWNDRTWLSQTAWHGVAQALEDIHGPWDERYLD